MNGKQSVSFERHDSVGYMVNLCARVFERRMAEALAPLGLKPAYLPVVFTLAAVGGTTQAELARSVAIEQPTMALTLRRMERDGIVYRVPDERDGRQAIVRLTPHAESLVPQVVSAGMEINRRAFRDAPEGSSVELVRLLAQAVDNLS